MRRPRLRLSNVEQLPPLCLTHKDDETTAPSVLIKRHAVSTDLLKQFTRHLTLAGEMGDQLAQLCLRSGQFWTHADVQKHNGVLRPGRCFETATRRAIRNSTHTYVEGFACSEKMPVPTRHAWTVDPAGRIVDSAWSDGRLYLGLSVQQSALERCLLATQKWGVFDYQIPNWLAHEY